MTYIRSALGKIYRPLIVFGIIAISFALAFETVFAQASGPANLIQNPSFETAGTNGNPANWARTYWGSPSPTFSYPVAGNGSAKAVQMTLTTNSSGDGRWQPATVAVEPGITYTYTSWYKSNVATEVNVVFTSSSGQVTYGWVANVTSSANAWKQLTATFTVPANVTKASVYHLIDRAGTLVIDDVSLVKGTTTPPPPPGGPTVTLSASPTSITQGQSSTLNWSSTNASSCTASGAWTGSKALSGSQTVTPNATATYTITCNAVSGSAITPVSQSVTVTVGAQPPPQGGFAEGMVSLTFDDSWTSQYTNVVPVLDTAGLKGTFYLTTQPIQGGWTGFMTPNQVKDIANKGHEIAGHTVTHADLTTLSQTRINAEIRNSKTYLQDLTGKVVTAFAYPYGAVNNTVKSLLQQAGYTSARGVDEESLNLATTDKYDLKSSCIETTHTMTQIKAEIDKAKANKQWFILCIHEVKNNGDQYTMTPARFQEIINYIKQTGIKVVTVREGRALMAN